MTAAIGGMACGTESGVIVLDVDGTEGRASLTALEQEHDSLPVTLTVETGGGGNHRYFVAPAVEVRNSVGKLVKGLDVRGDGGYVIVPQSIHPSGRAYQFVDESIALAEAPDWLLGRVLVSKAYSGQTHETPAERSILREGKRNDGLTRHAGWLRRKGADLPELEKKLLQANQRRCRPPLPEQEVFRIAASVARYPVGGPDTLESAWKQAAGKNYGTDEEAFLALCRCLQSIRRNKEIALPLERIAAMMGTHYTTVGRYRRNAVLRGVLIPT